jgi:hypothetical protein
MLIAGLILSASIAATMYLLRLGSDYLERVEVSNALSSKLPQAMNLIQTLDVEKGEGTEDMGDNVTLKWGAKLLDKSRPTRIEAEFTLLSTYEFLIYRVDFQLRYRSEVRDYKINVLKWHGSGTKPEFIL